MTFLTRPMTKNKALIRLGLGSFVPMSLFIMMTWLTVKFDIHIPQADWLYWLIYVVIALPLCWFGLSYWIRNKAFLLIATLLWLAVWGIVVAVSVLFVHVGIGGTL